MPKIYFYKLTHDDGGAPCIEDDLLSLAICKPYIRSTAEIGDILIGFAGVTLHRDNRLIYAARVTEPKLTAGDYFKLTEYARRPDCIYESKKGRFKVRRSHKYHGSKKDLEHDLGVFPSYRLANTLLSREFCYFGRSGSDSYKRFSAINRALSGLKEGHRVNHDAALLRELKALLASMCPLDRPLVQGIPTSGPRSGVSHRGGACGVSDCGPKRRC